MPAYGSTSDFEIKEEVEELEDLAKCLCFPLLAVLLATTLAADTAPTEAPKEAPAEIAAACPCANPGIPAVACNCPAFGYSAP